MPRRTVRVAEGRPVRIMCGFWNSISGFMLRKNKLILGRIGNNLRVSKNLLRGEKKARKTRLMVLFTNLCKGSQLITLGSDICHMGPFTWFGTQTGKFRSRFSAAAYEALICFGISFCEESSCRLTHKETLQDCTNICVVLSLCDISQSRSPERQESSFAFSLKYIFLCSARNRSKNNKFFSFFRAPQPARKSFLELCSLAGVSDLCYQAERNLSLEEGWRINSPLGRRRDFRESNSTGHFPLIRISRAEAKNCLLRLVFLLMTTNVIRLLILQTTTSFLLNIKISDIQVSEMPRNLPMGSGRRRPIIELNI